MVLDTRYVSRVNTEVLSLTLLIGCFTEFAHIFLLIDDGFRETWSFLEFQAFFAVFRIERGDMKSYKKQLFRNPFRLKML